VLGYSPVTAGAALLPWIAMLLLIGPFTGTLSERVPARLLVAGGLIVMAFGLLLLSGIDDNSSYLDLLPGLLVGGLGGALTIPLNAAAIGAVPVEKSGVASGIFNTARETGGSLGIAIIVPFSPAPRRTPSPTAPTPPTRSPPATPTASRSRRRSRWSPQSSR
jgi:MFS family permease